MAESHSITMLGTGLIADFYTATLHAQRRRERVEVVYSRSEDRARTFAERWSVPHWTTDRGEAVEHPETDTVIIGLPNHLHEEAVRAAAKAGKAILCKEEKLPDGRTKLILRNPSSGQFSDRLVSA